MPCATACPDQAGGSPATAAGIRPNSIRTSAPRRPWSSTNPSPRAPLDGDAFRRPSSYLRVVSTRSAQRHPAERPDGRYPTNGDPRTNGGPRPQGARSDVASATSASPRQRRRPTERRLPVATRDRTARPNRPARPTTRRSFGAPTACLGIGLPLATLSSSSISPGDTADVRRSKPRRTTTCRRPPCEPTSATASHDRGAPRAGPLPRQRAAAQRTPSHRRHRRRPPRRRRRRRRHGDLGRQGHAEGGVGVRFGQGQLPRRRQPERWPRHDDPRRRLRRGAHARGLLLRSLSRIDLRCHQDQQLRERHVSLPVRVRTSASTTPDRVTSTFTSCRRKNRGRVTTIATSCASHSTRTQPSPARSRAARNEPKSRSRYCVRVGHRYPNSEPRITPAEWDLATDCPGWTVRDNVSHLIAIERRLLGLPADPALTRIPRVREERHRASSTRTRSRCGDNRPGAEVLAEFNDVTAQRERTLAGMSTEDFDKVGWSPIGDVPYRRFMIVRLFDCWAHEQDIRRAVGRPGHLTGPVVDAAMALHRGSLGFIVGKKAGAPTGSIVAFSVTGPTTAHYVVEVHDRRAAVVDRCFGARRRPHSPSTPRPSTRCCAAAGPRTTRSRTTTATRRRHRARGRGGGRDGLRLLTRRPPQPSIILRRDRTPTRRSGR